MTTYLARAGGGVVLPPLAEIVSLNMLFIGGGMLGTLYQLPPPKILFMGVLLLVLLNSTSREKIGTVLLLLLVLGFLLFGLSQSGWSVSVFLSDLGDALSHID